jgi:hypothetical protein
VGTVRLMAERIVVLGWGSEALELDSALDADALVTGGSLRVSFTKYGGPLANAVVLVPTNKLLGRAMENSRKQDHERAFATLQRLCPRARLFDVDTPITVGL